MVFAALLVCPVLQVDGCDSGILQVGSQTDEQKTEGNHDCVTMCVPGYLHRLVVPSSSEIAEPFKLVEHLLLLLLLLLRRRRRRLLFEQLVEHLLVFIGLVLLSTVVPGPPGGQICRSMEHT